MTITEALKDLENSLQSYRMLLHYPGKTREIDCGRLRDDEILPLTVEELRRNDWVLTLKA